MMIIHNAFRISTTCRRATASMLVGFTVTGAPGHHATVLAQTAASAASFAPKMRAAFTADSTPLPPVIYPGSGSLRPGRVLVGVDTLTLLVTPPNGKEKVASTLVRELRHVQANGAALIREIQHYSSTTGTQSYDTLDVEQTSLAPVRYFSASGKAAMDLQIEGTHVTGWQTDSLGVRHAVDVNSRHTFFVSMMSESFIAAFPVSEGTAITMPMANPPNAAVNATVLRPTTIDTLSTAAGPIPCILVQGPGHSSFWLARSDGHLVRLRWKLPDGTTVWKLPSRDVAFR